MLFLLIITFSEISFSENTHIRYFSKPVENDTVYCECLKQHIYNDSLNKYDTIPFDFSRDFFYKKINFIQFYNQPLKNLIDYLDSNFRILGLTHIHGFYLSEGYYHNKILICLYKNSEEFIRVNICLGSNDEFESVKPFTKKSYYKKILNLENYCALAVTLKYNYRKQVYKELLNKNKYFLIQRNNMNYELIIAQEVNKDTNYNVPKNKLNNNQVNKYLSLLENNKEIYIDLPKQYYLMEDTEINMITSELSEALWQFSVNDLVNEYSLNVFYEKDINKLVAKDLYSFNCNTSNKIQEDLLSKGKLFVGKITTRYTFEYDNWLTHLDYSALRDDYQYFNRNYPNFNILVNKHINLYFKITNYQTLNELINIAPDIWYNPYSSISYHFPFYYNNKDIPGTYVNKFYRK